MLYFTAAEAPVIEAGDAEKKKMPKVCGTAYTGGALRQRFVSAPIVVDLASMSISAEQIPLLWAHDHERIVGHASAEVSAQRVRITGIVSGVGEHASNVVAMAANGYPWQLSIGASPGKLEFVDKGESVLVNGRRWSGPLYVARGASLSEVSFVAVGADSKTSASIAATSYREEPSMKFSEWLKAKGFDEATLTNEQKATLQAAFDAELLKASGDPEEELEAGDDEEAEVQASAKKRRTPAGSDGDSVDGSIAAFRREIASDFKRVGRINALRERYKDQDEIIAKAIEEGWSEDKTELALMRKARPEPVKAASAQENEIEGEVVTAALMVNLGMDDKIIAESFAVGRREQVMNRAHSADYRGFGLRDLGAMLIRAANRSYSGSFTGTGMLSAVREAARDIRAAGFTTLSLPYVFGTVANRALLAGYNRPQVKWRSVVGKRSVKDFRPNYEVRFQLGAGGIQKVGKDGQLKHVKFEDAQASYRIETRGGIVAITREDWINDDLGALMQIPEMLGWLAATSVEEEVWKLLINPTTGTFYRSSGTNPNLISGGGSALSIDALTSAKTLFMDKQINGRPIAVSPEFLIVGSALEVVADQLLKDTTIIATQLGSTSSRKVEPATNPHVGTLTRLTSPYLNNTALRDSDGNALTGQSATQWFLLANPGVLAAFLAAFLNGQENPTVETQDSSVSDFDVLGTSMRVYIDFGVAESNDIAIVKSAGA
jgi:hypothetical protein